MANITIHPFRFKHLKLLHEILTSRQYEGVADITIVLLDKTPIAAGFLRRLEPCFAQIDTLASNSYFGAIVRNEGISLIVDTLINDAKALKLKGIISHTNNEGILTRAKALGFHIVNQSIIALPM